MLEEGVGQTWYHPEEPLEVGSFPPSSQYTNQSYSRPLPSCQQPDLCRHAEGNRGSLPAATHMRLIKTASKNAGNAKAELKL